MSHGDYHPNAADYDKPETHQLLIDRLCSEFPDGWALSLNAQGLRAILPMCPEDVRVMAWVKPKCNYWKQKNRIAYAWEPLILRGGRHRSLAVPTMRDWFSCSPDLQAGFAGAKPSYFSKWVFELLGMEPEDEFHDLFPGSGAVARAWGEWKANASIFQEERPRRVKPQALRFLFGDAACD